MRLKRALAAAMTGALIVSSMAGCGSKNDSSSKSGTSKEKGNITYESVKLGETGKDLKTTITMFNNRTDLDSDKYNGTTWKQYLADFNNMYPNIKVKIKTDTNYADDALTHLQSGDYETVMGIPAIDKSDLSTYFISYGKTDEMKKQVNYSNTWEYDGDVYGVASLATTQGIVYNKKVFEKAGITELPKTPSEFIDALQKIKDKTDAIPLYTNYAAGWTMGAWDAYIGINATGDNTYMNQKLVHTKDPFKDYGDDTHAYAVYKILYDAVNKGLTEDDYSTTDWEGCKVKINDGKIGCMVLGSWSYPQMAGAGKHGQHRALLHLIDFHDAAVSAHNHERHIHAGLPDTLLSGVGRVQHLWQDAGVDGRCPGPSGQAVELGNVRGNGCLHAHLVMGNLEHKLLPGNVVHPVSV